MKHSPTRKKSKVRSAQQEMHLPTWGGRRRGAGRKPSGPPRVGHGPRQRITRHTPVHVTLRVRKDVPRLRRRRVFQIVRRCIALACQRLGARIVEFNVLSDHIHLLCEAADRRSLSRAIQGLCIRVAKQINHRLGRKGPVFADRFHMRPLRTPREVHNCLVYILNNARHHAAERGERLSRYWVDPYSSAPHFRGWKRRLPRLEPYAKELIRDGPATAEPRSWLLCEGWRRHGLLDFDEMPGGRKSP